MPANRFNCQQTLIRVIVLFCAVATVYRPAAGRCSPSRIGSLWQPCRTFKLNSLERKRICNRRSSVAVLCVIRNTGTAPLPENAAVCGAIL